jgi:hypothetical protein
LPLLVLDPILVESGMAASGAQCAAKSDIDRRITARDRASSGERRISRRGDGLGSRALRSSSPAAEIAVSAMWHPRMEADAAHRWLRGRVIGFCRKVYP